MKKCPQCGREYDLSMSFCLDDGSELLYGPASSPTSIGPATAILPVSPAAADYKEIHRALGHAYINSIAVLPFVNMSSDVENEYFCEGLAEELLNALAKIDKLKVAARTSAFSFKGRDATIRDIAAALNVRPVLEGSVRRAGDKLRITAQLINASDGYHLWSERYDREMKDVFDVQDEIAIAVVDALKLRLIAEQKEAVLKRHTADAEALEAYLRGVSYFSKFTPDYFRKAVDFFETAIRLDPHYAEAYAGLAECYSEMSFFTAPAEWMPKARDAARKAMELDDKLGRAHNALAVIKMYYDRDYAGAESDFKNALVLDPGSAHIRMWYGWFLGLSRRFDEGSAEMTRAREIDPLSPLIRFGIGAINLWAGGYDKAIEQFRAIVELHSDFSLGHQYLATAYIAKGDIDAALATAENAPASPDDPFSMTSAACVYARAGKLHRAMELLAEIERLSVGDFELSVQVAQVYVSLGDIEAAFSWLEKAFAEHSVWPNWLAVDPIFEPLRDDPKYEDLRGRLNLPK